MKNHCEKHHYTFEGNRCPLCEKERIASMALRFSSFIVEDNVRTIHNIRDKSDMEKYMKPVVDWEDLCDKFIIVKK